MGVVKDAIVLSVYAAGVLGAAVLIGSNLIGQSAEDSATVTADAQAATITLDIDTLSAMLPPCEHEDTIPVDYACLWDTTTRGNNMGVSFIALSNGEVIYLAE